MALGREPLGPGLRRAQFIFQHLGHFQDRLLPVAFLGRAVHGEQDFGLQGGQSFEDGLGIRRFRLEY
jgi:hypothetical protein